MSDVYELEDELTLLDPQQVRLFLDEFEDLRLALDGVEVEGRVSAVRAFPISADQRFVILKDGEDKEIGIIRDAADLDADSQSVLRAELDRSYFCSRITGVNAIGGHFHVPEWDVVTDRGPRVFEIRSSRRDIRILGEGHVLILDADGNRYEIPDYHQLDPISRGLLESQL